MTLVSERTIGEEATVRSMVVENGGELEKGSMSAAVIVIVGITIGAVSASTTYMFAYGGWGPAPGHILILILLGMISSIVLILMGIVAFRTQVYSGQEVAGFSEVRRKRP